MRWSIVSIDDPDETSTPRSATASFPSALPVVPVLERAWGNRRPRRPVPQPDRGHPAHHPPGCDLPAPEGMEEAGADDLLEGALIVLRYRYPSWTSTA